MIYVNSKQEMNVNVVSFRRVPGSMISKETTMYKIQSRNQENSAKAAVVEVERRFNDFRLLHEKLLNDSNL